MKGGKKTPLGYTIIEVLIVLAVSGMMFVIATNFINGKQDKASFTQGTNEMASQVQGVIEQVTNGQFSDIPLNCSFAGGVTSVNSGVRPPGTNSSCVFLGKILRFHSGTPNTYEIVSLAAGRVTKDAAGNAITPTLANTGPAVASALTKTQNVPQQLTVKSVRVTDATTGAVRPNAYNFGFAQGLGTVKGDSFQSGAQTITMIYSSANLSVPGTPATSINGSNLGYARAAVICMTDGPRFAQILVGATADNASQLSVRRQAVPTC